MMNEATWKTWSSKEENFNQLWKCIKEMKETILTQNEELKETILIQNGKLDKLTKITQNLENKILCDFS